MYTFVTNTTETEEFADSLQWAHNMGKVAVERLRERFFVIIDLFLYKLEKHADNFGSFLGLGSCS